MKRFAYLKWADTKDDIKLQHHWIKKMPLLLKDRYILKNCPIQIEERLLKEAEGFKVLLPITLEQVRRKSPTYTQKIIDRAMEILDKNRVKIICPPKEEGGKFSYSIRKARGEWTIPFLMYPAILKAEKLLDKKLKHIEITILDGKNKKTDLILDLLYPHVNYLNILTDQPERLKEKAMEIYEDVGLNLQILSHNKQTLLEGSNIIIDCIENNHTDFYYTMKNGVYFYLGGNIEMVKNILLNRSDLLVVDDFILSLQNEKLSTAFCEMIWFVSKPWFDPTLSKEYSIETLKNITREIKRDGWIVEKFCSYGKEYES